MVESVAAWTHQPVAMVWFLLFLGALHVVPVPIVWVIGRAKGRDMWSVMRKVLAWTPVSLVALLAIFGGTWGLFALFVVICTAALREYLRCVGAVTRISAFVGLYMLLGGHLCLVALGDVWWVLVALPLASLVLLPSLLWLSGERQGFAHTFTSCVAALLFCGVALSHVALFMTCRGTWTLPGHRASYVVVVLFLPQFNDAMQYVCGKLFGRHRITPRISPNKTWEGFVGGVLLTTLAGGVLVPALLPLSRNVGFVCGALMAVAGFLGDITISSVKRRYGHKDTGRALGAFGGVLDRVDSLLYTAPLFFYAVSFLTS